MLFKKPKAKFGLLHVKSEDLRLYNLPDKVPYLSSEVNELKSKGLKLEHLYEIIQLFIQEKPNYEENGRYQLFVRKWPIHEEVRRIISNESQTQWNRAEKLCQQIIAMDPNEPLAYYHLGFILRRMGRYLESEQAYLKAIELMPNHGNFYANVGRTYEASGQTEKAIMAWSKALELMPGDVSSLETLERLGVFVSVYSDPKKPETKTWIKREDYEKALLEKFEEIKQDAEALKESGLALVHDDTLIIGLKYLQQAAILEPNDPEVWLSIAATYHQMKEYERGLQAIERHLLLMPASGIGYTNKAKLLAGLGKEEEAESFLKQALELDPNQENALHWYYLMMKEKGQEKEGRAFLEVLAEHHPQAYELYMVLAVYYEDIDIKQSITWYRMAYERVPDNIKAAYPYAGILGRVGRHTEAVKILEPFRSHITKDWRLCWNLGQAYFYAGKPKGAIKLFKEVIADPEISPSRRIAIQHQIATWQGKVVLEGKFISQGVFLYIPGDEMITIAGTGTRVPHTYHTRISLAHAKEPIEVQVLQGIGPTPGENRLLRHYVLSNNQQRPFALQIVFTIDKTGKFWLTALDDTGITIDLLDKTFGVEKRKGIEDNV